MAGRVLSAVAAAGRILESKDEGKAVAVVLSLESGEGGECYPGQAGRRLLVELHKTEGTLGDPELDAAAGALALQAIEAQLAWASPSREGPAPSFPAEGTHRLRLPEREREARIYLELHLPRPQLIIVGAGHIARPLCTLGALLDFRVTVLDDRAGFATSERFPEAERIERVDFSNPFADVTIGPWSHVVLVTRGHRYDYECLRRMLRLEPPARYIGMIGSRRRVRATFVRLREEGVARERIEQVHAPVGLDLGAETPEEIAVSVAAELTLLRRGGSGRPLREIERVAERFLGD